MALCSLTKRTELSVLLEIKILYFKLWACLQLLCVRYDSKSSIFYFHSLLFDDTGLQAVQV